MGSQKRVFELRKENRYRVREGAFAASDTSAQEVGQILDVSMGGLAFSYLDQGERSRGIFGLDIFLADNSFYMEKVQARIISDDEIPNDDPFSLIKMRRRGVQFIDLTPDQKSKLRSFIFKSVKKHLGETSLKRNKD